MSKRFRHKGCSTEMLRYVGLQPLTDALAMNLRDWLVNGEPPSLGDSITVRCPDCLKLIRLRKPFMEEIT